MDELTVPQWLSPVGPRYNEKQDPPAPNKVHASYDTRVAVDIVVGRYETILRQWHEAGVSYTEGGNAKRSYLVGSQGNLGCSVEVSPGTNSSHVDIVCKLQTDAEMEAAGRVLAKMANKGAENSKLPAGVHRIEYVVDGDCGSAGLTFSNGGGSTEQHDVDLPATISFRATPGSFLYIAAQKKGKEGTVHVVIRVDGVLVRQSAATSPYGIASANGRLGK